MAKSAASAHARADHFDLAAGDIDSELSGLAEVTGDMMGIIGLIAKKAGPIPADSFLPHSK